MHIPEHSLEERVKNAHVMLRMLAEILHQDELPDEAFQQCSGLECRVLRDLDQLLQELMHQKCDT